MSRTLSLILVALCLCTHANAEESFDFNELVGVKHVDAEVLASMGCNELYELATLLEPETRHQRSAILNENTDTVVSAVSMVFKPAIYVYSVTIPWHIKEDYRMQKTTLSLDTVRRQMSALRCFEK